MKIIAALFLVILLGVVTRVSGEEVEFLSFYVVSSECPINGTFIDTKEMPKLGYIRHTPDLLVTNIVSVNKDHTTLTRVITMNGQTEPQQIITTACLAVTLQTNDAVLFQNLTSESIGKKILLMLGSEPLVAPVVRFPIKGNSLAIEVPEDKINRLEKRLKKLEINKANNGVEPIQ